MSKIRPTKAQLFNGLRRRPKYEEISQEINPDKTNTNTQTVTLNFSEKTLE